MVNGTAGVLAENENVRIGLASRLVWAKSFILRYQQPTQNPKNCKNNHKKECRDNQS
jgi:hypothetical protein